jgi:hypothetical protein
MNMYGGVEVEIRVLLTSALVGNEWYALSLGKLLQVSIGQENVWAP